MSETLEIRNFGPISQLKLDIKPITILIGEQATGKSTIAKLLGICRYFSYIIENSDNVSLSSSFERGLIHRGMQGSIQENTYIEYDCPNYKLTVRRIIIDDYSYDEETETTEHTPYLDFEQILLPKSNEFKNLLHELNKIKPESQVGYGFGNFEWAIPFSFFDNDVKRVMDNPFYFPTERGLQSIFSLGKNSAPNISDILYNYFAKVERIVRQYKSEIIIEPLDIVYKNDVRAGGVVKKKDEDAFYNMENAASGYQSTVPIILVIDYYSDVIKRKKTFIIEEPEMNLFPSAQNRLIQYLIDKTINYGNTTFITTHSPYVLTSLNNLMYAYEVGLKSPEKVGKIIDKKYWINSNEVSAYRLLKNGKLKNIIDDEIKQIDTGELDEISRSINDIWDKIADIEHGRSSEN